MGPRPGIPVFGTYNFVGLLNATKFIPDPESLEKTNQVDSGPDYYAALPFSGLPDTDKVDIA